MTNRLLPLLVVIIIVITTIFYSHRINTESDEIDQAEDFIKTMKPIVDEKTHLSLYNLEDSIDASKVFGWMRYALAPRHLASSIQTDTVLTLFKESTTDQQMAPVINKNRKVLWQEKHLNYYLVLTCSKDGAKQ